MRDIEHKKQKKNTIKHLSQIAKRVNAKNAIRNLDKTARRNIQTIQQTS